MTPATEPGPLPPPRETSFQCMAPSTWHTVLLLHDSSVVYPCARNLVLAPIPVSSDYILIDESSPARVVSSTSNPPGPGEDLFL